LAEQQAREAAKNRVENVPFEVEQDEIEQHYPTQNKLEQQREKQPNRKQNQPVFTANNAPTVENNADENSETKNNADANSPAPIANSQGANSTAPAANTANKRITPADIFRAEQAAKKQAGERLNQDKIEQVEPIELEPTTNKIAANRADSARVNKSQTIVDFGGKQFTIRQLETMRNTYSKRAVDTNFSEVSRQSNQEKADQIDTILSLLSQQ
jgi:hypothetical protein